MLRHKASLYLQLSHIALSVTPRCLQMRLTSSDLKPCWRPPLTVTIPLSAHVDHGIGWLCHCVHTNIIFTALPSRRRPHINCSLLHISLYDSDLLIREFGFPIETFGTTPTIPISREHAQLLCNGLQDDRDHHMYGLQSFDTCKFERPT